MSHSKYDWMERYQAGDTPWDKGRPSPPLKSFLGARRVEGRVLVPGCGAGHDVRLLARAGAEAVGLDLVPQAVELARSYPPAGRERYCVGDFLSGEAANWGGPFDWVVEHTCLCALEPFKRPAYARAVRAALRPGGSFLAVFYRVVPDDDGKGPPRPISREESAALFEPDFELEESFVPEKTYPSRPPGCEEVCWYRLRL